MDVAEAYSLISRAIDSGHAAHGYLIVGDVRGNGSELVRRILLKLFPDATAQVESGSHPDVATLEPEGKARIITVESMRERIVAPMSTTAFSGGWKVGVIYGADRLRAEAANAFLKSLEEPTPQTLYLMVTDQPDGILPTIVSRSQRIDLPLPAGLLEGEALAEVSKAFAAKDAAALVEKLKELKDEADDADVPLVRKTFFKTLLSFARQMMLAGKLPRHQAFRNIEAIEDAYRQSDRANMSDDLVISFLLDRIVFP
jgi:DNA polymerase III subunit delta'